MFLGIEIGGTKIQAALGPGDGVKLPNDAKTGQLPVVREAGHLGILQTLDQRLPTLVAGRTLRGLGVGFGGPVDAANGRAVESNQIQGWKDFEFRPWFAERFPGVPVSVGNDSDLAGWAEAVHGGGRGASPVLYMNIGTGIGGALVIDGKVYNGQGLGATEIGHLRVLPDAPGLPWRTLESLVAGLALDERAKALGFREGKDIPANAKLGHLECQRIWLEAAELWGVALANAATLLCPQRIVLGGGVANEQDYLFAPLRAAFRRQVFGPFRDAIEIVGPELGEDMVMHGALMLAASECRGEEPK